MAFSWKKLCNCRSEASMRALLTTRVQKFSCYLVLLLLACRMDRVFRPFTGVILCWIGESQTAKFFVIWGTLSLLRRFLILCDCGETPSGERGLIRDLSLSYSEGAHFYCQIDPILWMHSKNARKFRVRPVAFSVAIPISSTFWACWSTLKTGSKYQRKTPETANTDLLRPCSSLLKSKVLLRKLNASIYTDCWFIFYKQW